VKDRETELDVVCEDDCGRDMECETVNVFDCSTLKLNVLDADEVND